MSNVIIETDLGFYIFIGIVLLLTILMLCMFLYMKLETMHNQFNDAFWFYWTCRSNPMPRYEETEVQEDAVSEAQ